MANGRVKDDTPKEESIERAWASNDKLVFDERTAHSNRTAVIAEDALEESVNFTKQIHNEYLKREQHATENNRFTLDYLYGVYPLESLGTSAIGNLLKQIVKEEMSNE
jgi:hypothetical protein